MSFSRPDRTPDGLVDDTAYRRTDGSFALRDGHNPIERMALHRAGLDVAAFPASMVVQLAMWPNLVATLARESGRSTAMFYNALTLANGRPYHTVRRAFAGYLRQIAGVRGLDVEPITVAAVDHLLVARPAAHHGETPIAAPGRRDAPLPLPDAPAWDAARPPTVRDGGNPVERMALHVLHRHAAAMPASEIVQVALWPASLAAWAKAAELEPGAVYNALAWRNGWAYTGVRQALARRLGVSVFALDALIEAPRADAPPPTPSVPAPPELQPSLPLGG